MKKLLYIFFPFVLFFFSSCEDESEDNVFFEENTTPDGLVGTTWTKRFIYNNEEVGIVQMIFESNTSFQWWEDYEAEDGLDGIVYQSSSNYVLSDNIFYINNDTFLCDNCPVSYTAIFNGESIIINEVLDPVSGINILEWTNGEDGPWVFIQE